MLTTEKRLFGEQVNDAVLLLLMGFTHARGTTTKCFAFLFYLRRVDLVAHPPGTRSISYLLFRKKKGRPPTGRHPAVLLIAEPTIPWPFHLTKKKIFCPISFFFFTARANRLRIFSFTSFVRKIVRNQYYKTGEVARQLSPAVDERAFRFPWPVLLLSFPSRILFSALLAWNHTLAAEKRWCGHWPRERERDGRPDGKGEREIQMNGPSCPVIGRTTRCFVFACPATFSVQKVFWHFFPNFGEKVVFSEQWSAIQIGQTKNSPNWISIFFGYYHRGGSRALSLCRRPPYYIIVLLILGRQLCTTRQGQPL